MPQKKNFIKRHLVLDRRFQNCIAVDFFRKWDQCPKYKVLEPWVGFFVYKYISLMNISSLKNQLILALYFEYTVSVTKLRDLQYMRINRLFRLYYYKCPLHCNAVSKEFTTISNSRVFHIGKTKSTISKLPAIYLVPNPCRLSVVLINSSCL